MVDREMRRGGEGTRTDEERGGATLPGSGRRAGRCARPGANAHRLPIRHRSQGSSRPRMSKSVTKGFLVTGRMKENLGIMRLCSVRMRAAQAFVSDLDIHGSLRAPAPAAGDAGWVHHRQRGPGQLGQFTAQAGACQTPEPMATPQDGRFVARAGTRVAWSCWPGGSCLVSSRSRQPSGSSCATAARRARASSSQVWQRWARASPRSHSARESSRGTEPASRRCTTATSSSRARS